jgi:secreted Zn-dependent insulinase-like peptidase
VALEKPSWTVSEQLTALLTINKRDFFRYASQLFSKVHLKSFAYGNIDSQRVCFPALSIRLQLPKLMMSSLLGY